MLKLLIDLAIIAVIGYLIYIKFFKKDAKEKELDPNEMIECDCCGVFVERKSMKIANDKNYCSEICYQKGVSK